MRNQIIIIIILILHLITFISITQIKCMDIMLSEQTDFPDALPEFCNAEVIPVFPEEVVGLSVRTDLQKELSLQYQVLQNSILNLMQYIDYLQLQLSTVENTENKQNIDNPKYLCVWCHIRYRDSETRDLCMARHSTIPQFANDNELLKHLQSYYES